MDQRPRGVDRLKGKAPGLHRFLTRTDSPWPFVRDIAIGALVLLIVLSSLWMYTGRWGHSPVVVVESGSMMHCSNGLGSAVALGRDCDSSRFGRVGTIDPGDLIFVKDVDGPGEVETFAEGGESRYHGAGDVIVYKPNGGDLAVPVIHRAMFWIEVEADGSYTFPDLGIERSRSLDVDDLGIDAAEYRIGPGCQDVAFAHQLRPGMAGFITKGDNNECFDQSSSGLQYLPVDPEWIVGKARGEVPWLGLVKLFVTDFLNSVLGRPHEPNYHNAAGDTKVLLWGCLIVLVGGPYTYEKVKHGRMRREQAKAEAEKERAAAAARTKAAPTKPEAPGKP